MVKVNNVYQKVLALANKEQRGYITPQEFNLFADLAQIEIFEQYFFDIDQGERKIGSDVLDITNHRVQAFMVTGAPLSDWQAGTLLSENTHSVQTVWAPQPAGKTTWFERVEKKDIRGISSTPLLSSHLSSCYYVFQNKLYLTADPGELNVVIDTIRKPEPPNWTYLIDPNIDSNALYNLDAPDHRDFELHSSEEGKLVAKILQLAGINMKDYNLAQLAGQKEASINQQEKQ